MIASEGMLAQNEATPISRWFIQAYQVDDQLEKGAVGRSRSIEHEDRCLVTELLVNYTSQARGMT